MTQNLAARKRDWTRLLTWPLVALFLGTMAISPEIARLNDGTIISFDIILTTLLVSLGYCLIALVAAFVRILLSNRKSRLGLPFGRLSMRRSLGIIGLLVCALSIKAYGFVSFPPLLYVGLYFGCCFAGIGMLGYGWRNNVSDAGKPSATV